MSLSKLKFSQDPFRRLEYPVAIFVINITLFTILWKTVGLSWLPFGLDESFNAVFTGGYYPRDMRRHESAYNLFFLFAYGVLGTAAQIASLRIAGKRRSSDPQPGHSRWVFAAFHVVIAVYHVLFVFQIIKGKMLLDGIAPWQMFATQALYVLELVMAIELLLASKASFFRRKVCMDVLSMCNLLPLVFFWGFATVGFNNANANKIVEILFFAFLPLLVLISEWVTWYASNRTVVS